jgi:choline dehydrogenase-like flavoprotein
MTSAHGSQTESDSVSASGSRSVDEVIVGDRLSGLISAHKLARAGKSVVVLEASDRPGGRVQNGIVGGTVCGCGSNPLCWHRGRQRAWGQHNWCYQRPSERSMRCLPSSVWAQM